jgi:magnesium chelatase accessory protein
MPSASFLTEPAQVAHSSTYRAPPPHWPLRAHSMQLRVGPHCWHYQQLGQGPVLLLLHGTGASTHSFRALAPRLAQHFTVLMPDLPGHGFTQTDAGADLSLPAVSADVAALLDALSLRARWIAGHSAGAAIATQMALAEPAAAQRLIGINAAILPLRGLAGQLFLPLAQLVAGRDLFTSWIARRASDPKAIARLLAGTGSQLDAEGVALYRWLFSDPSHIAGVIRLMAHWDLEPLARALPTLQVPLHLLVASGDRTIPPRDSARVSALCPRAEMTVVSSRGHLAHEEEPAVFAARLEALCQ